MGKIIYVTSPLTKQLIPEPALDEMVLETSEKTNRLGLMLKDEAYHHSWRFENIRLVVSITRDVNGEGLAMVRLWKEVPERVKEGILENERKKQYEQN